MTNFTLIERLKMAWFFLRNKMPIPSLGEYEVRCRIKPTKEFLDNIKGEWCTLRMTVKLDYLGNWHEETIKILPDDDLINSQMNSFMGDLDKIKIVTGGDEEAEISIFKRH